MIASIILASLLSTAAVQQPRHHVQRPKPHVTRPVQKPKPKAQPIPQPGTEEYAEWIRSLFGVTVDALKQ